MNPELIQSAAHMDELLRRLSNEELIAADTEFFRETSYYPQLALVQIATDAILACIDPLAFDAKPGLQQIFLDQQLTKVFHSCSQDMEVLFYYLGETPVSIFDTQIASALLSEHYQIGYASLVENELGIQLDKSQTRTNWLQRPLTDQQIEYAGDDVFYLYQLYKLLDKKLQHAGRKKWFAEECSRLFAGNSNYQVETDKLWKRVKGAVKLNRDKLAIVQAIAQWREQLAQQKDITRRRVLADDIIIQLALHPPENISTLNQLIVNKYKLNDAERQQLFKSIISASQSPAETWPDNQFTVLDSQQKLLLKELQQIVNKKAEQLQVSSSILTTKKELETLILYFASSNEAPDKSQLHGVTILQGWRFHCFGQQLIETIKNSR
ncbi:MAG: ribonuclease D [Gammaproteobacteria bacterium]|nr:ribonuclease D [Gammaproteobacteria bacterium]